MLETISASISNGMPPLNAFLLSSFCSILFGFAVAAIYMFRNRYSKNMAVTLVLLPVTVQAIITVVSGNIGAGIAVAGAFSLVRFRSVQGNARDIGSLFLAMAVGLVIGQGYIFYAFIFILLFGLTSLLLVHFQFGQGQKNTRFLKIIIPENLDYEGLFDDIFARYTSSFELDQVRTTSMGSLFELSYLVQLKTASMSKEFIDEIRCRNGNLNIQFSREHSDGKEL